MTEEPINLVLEHLRAIRSDLVTLGQGQRELINRVGRLERQVADLHPDYASLSIRLDRLDGRVERIEQRLTLADA